MEVEDKVQENSSLLQDNEDVFDRTDIQRNNPMEDRDFDRNQGIVIDSSEEIFDKNESLSEYETETGPSRTETKRRQHRLTPKKRNRKPDGHVVVEKPDGLLDGHVVVKPDGLLDGLVVVKPDGLIDGG